MVEADLHRVHSDVGVHFPAARANPVEIAFAHEYAAATQAFSPYPALPSTSFYNPSHIIYLLSSLLIKKPLALFGLLFFYY